MTITQPTTRRGPSGDLHCPRCNASVPANAAFCVACGERLESQRGEELGSKRTSDDTDMNTRYRITSLIRRRPYINLFFAIDNQQSHMNAQRMVAIRDIDMSSLNDEARMTAVKSVQREYDLLRYWQIPSVMPVIDLKYFQNHLFTVTSWRSRETLETNSGASIDTSATAGVEGEISTGINEPQGALTDMRRLFTLQDLLQSGRGLPSEEISLGWMRSLCQTLDDLHRREFVIGDLDPYTIVFNGNSYEDSPALMVSWMPAESHILFPAISTTATMSYFSAPEALLGRAEPRSDIYSLGAILYLLLTGTAPDVEPSAGLIRGAGSESEQAVRGRRRLRSPRELNSKISSHLDECVMCALSIDPAGRFSSAGAMAEALFDPERLPAFRRSLERGRSTSESRQQQRGSAVEEEGAQEQEVDTVRIVPLSQEHLRRWRSSQPLSNNVIPRRPQHVSDPLEEDMEASLLFGSSSTGTGIPEGQPEDAQAGVEKREQSSFVGENAARDYPPAPGHSTNAASSQPDFDSDGMQQAGENGSSPDEVSTLVTPGPALSEGPQPTMNVQNRAGVINRVPTTEVPGFLAEEMAVTSPPVNSAVIHEREEASGEQDLAPARSTAPSRTIWDIFRQIFQAILPRPRRQTASTNLPAVTSGSLSPAPVPAERTFPNAEDNNPSFLKQVQRALLGEQRHSITAAAIIETPLRVQPNQSYTIRIHIMGRDEPQFMQKSSNVTTDTPMERRKNGGEHLASAQAGGLSALIHGELVSIEVRTALHQSYTYIVQQAGVHIPARGYAAEVTIPMQPLSSGPSGRRDRLHIFFLDEARRPLYEKPFVVEVFVSHLVQPGREGHAVLTIPL